MNDTDRGRRDRFIAAALTGLLADNREGFDHNGIATTAVQHADAVLTAAGTPEERRFWEKKEANRERKRKELASFSRIPRKYD